MSTVLVLWLALAADPGVDYYVVDGNVDIGEVAKLPGGAGYAVRLDGVDGGDIMFTVRALAEVLPMTQKRLGFEPTRALKNPQAAVLSKWRH